MSTKLDQSLDVIMKDNRKNRRRNPRRAAQAGKPAPPVGGVQKTMKTTKQEKVTIPTGPKTNHSKILVSNLPLDVKEADIKDYFATTIGPVRKILLYYGPNGQSRGSAEITFVHPDSAAKAVAELDKVKVDKRPIKVEIILDAQSAPAPPPTKTLGDRVTKPKSEKAQPKPATATKDAGKKAGRGRGRVRGRGGRRGENPRGKPKSAEELDQEMADYWEGGANGADTAMATNGGAVQPAAANGDTGMEDEIM